MIRYLEKDEYGACRALWQEAFPEDSREFADYYFNKKLLQGRVMVKEDDTGRMVTMAHLNPYIVKAGSMVWNLDYIVGVATAANSRHQGHMRDVLVKMLLDMHHEGKPFCYLMPASPDIYRPFGFRYIFDQPLWRLRREAEETLERIEVRFPGTECSGTEQSGQRQDCGAQADTDQRSRNYNPGYIADWINRWLSERYEVYALRDPGYMEMLMAELDSEAGQIYGWYGGDGSLEALQAFWGQGKRDQRFLYCARDEWREPVDADQPARPAIMARITDVAAFAGMITLDEECPCAAMEIKVRIRDALIPGNNGLWNWRLDRNGSSLKPEKEPGKEAGDMESGLQPDQLEAAAIVSLVSTEVLDITVEQLASWLFGYSSLEQAMETDLNELPFWHRYIRPLSGVFLDEIV